MYRSNLNQNLRKLICGYQQTDSKVYVERDKRPRRANTIQMENKVKGLTLATVEPYYKSKIIKTEEY
jgi:hypothetical protein